MEAVKSLWAQAELFMEKRGPVDIIPYALRCNEDRREVCDVVGEDGGLWVNEAQSIIVTESYIRISLPDMVGSNPWPIRVSGKDCCFLLELMKVHVGAWKREVSERG